MLGGKLACVSMAFVTKSLNSMGRSIKMPMLFNKNINAVPTLMYPFILIQSFKLGLQFLALLIAVVTKRKLEKV